VESDLASGLRSGGGDEPVVRAVADTATRYAIEPALFADFMSSMRAVGRTGWWGVASAAAGIVTAATGSPTAAVTPSSADLLPGRTRRVLRMCELPLVRWMVLDGPKGDAAGYVEKRGPGRFTGTWLTCVRLRHVSSADRNAGVRQPKAAAGPRPEGDPEASASPVHRARSAVVLSHEGATGPVQPPEDCSFGDMDGGATSRGQRLPEVIDPMAEVVP
jgi:hypothetical protein